MSDLTEDQQRAFGDRITQMYGDPDTLAALTTVGSGLDPSKRLAKLKAKQTTATEAEGEQTKKKAALKTATTVSVAATEDFYAEASAAAGALAKELGEENALSQEIHRIRPSMSNETTRGSKESGTGTQTNQSPTKP